MAIRKMSVSQIRRVLDTAWGRKSGWFVEHDGRIVAVLEDYRQVDMFWASYQLEVTTKDEQVARKLLDIQFWQEHFYEQGFTIRSREFGLIADRCLVSALISGRLSVRGLFVSPPGPAWKIRVAQAINLLLGRQW